MALSAELRKRLVIAVTDATIGAEIADVVDAGTAAIAQMPIVVAGAIVATSVSQTTDFGSLKVGDKVAMIPATAGSADFITISVAGDLGQAAVVGNLYIVLRARA